jgi:hypothetical protein
LVVGVTITKLWPVSNDPVGEELIDILTTGLGGVVGVVIAMPENYDHLRRKSGTIFHK